MKIKILGLFILLSSISFSQKKINYNDAQINGAIEGVYIFMNCKPINEYDYIQTIKVSMTWSTSIQESFKKIIKKAKRKNKNFNGMIFLNSSLSRVDLIKFKGLKVTRRGFSQGDYVTFVKTIGNHREKTVGQIMILDSYKNHASIKYKLPKNKTKIYDISYKILTKINKQEYDNFKFPSDE